MRYLVLAAFAVSSFASLALAQTAEIRYTLETPSGGSIPQVTVNGQTAYRVYRNESVRIVTNTRLFNGNAGAIIAAATHPAFTPFGSGMISSGFVTYRPTWSSVSNTIYAGQAGTPIFTFDGVAPVVFVPAKVTQSQDGLGTFGALGRVYVGNQPFTPVQLLSTVNGRMFVTASWQNQSLNVDVNGDGFVSPLDALLVINYLNSSGAGMVPNASPSNGMLDVTGDKYITAVDALAVINHLNGN